MNSDNNYDNVFDVGTTGGGGPRGPRRPTPGGFSPHGLPLVLALTLFVGLPILAIPYMIYTQCRIEVPTGYMAVLFKKTGLDIPNNEEIAPDAEHRGIQKDVLTEGRHYYNPWDYDWIVVPQIEIPAGKLGVRTRLYGDNLPQGDLIAWKENQKGIVPQVLQPARYAINAWLVGDSKRPGGDSYAETIELFEPVTVPAGFQGIVTLLSAPMPDDPNVILVADGRRGVQKKALDAGTYYINPYVQRIDLIDCRSQRFNLGSGDMEIMGFPTKDGFWVTLDGRIEFRIKPEQAANVFVLFNDANHAESIDQKIINKVILPNARSFCRLQGSNHSGRDFISGETRTQFQKDFQVALASKCEAQGIEVLQALITNINPLQQIAGPVRARQIALQTAKQYQQEILQQKAEQELAIERELVNRKKDLVGAQQEVVKVVTQAAREKEVALIQANQRLKVTEFELKAAQDIAAATMARGKAAADVIQFDNAAEAAGWKKAVEAFGGNGYQYAHWVLLKKLAPAYQKMMVNTADSPLMDIFGDFNVKNAEKAVKTGEREAEAAKP